MSFIAFDSNATYDMTWDINQLKSNSKPSPFKFEEPHVEDAISAAVPSPRSKSPRTPTQKTVSRASFLCGSAPQTPRQSTRMRATTPPPAPSVAQKPKLMQGLEANSVALVQEAIEAEPNVAREPFWDHGYEPPICFAVRKRCKVDIIAMLLRCGAARDAKDVLGRSPAYFLKSMRKEMADPSCYEDLNAIEQMFDMTSVNSDTFGARHSDNVAVENWPEQFATISWEVFSDGFFESIVASLQDEYL